MQPDYDRRKNDLVDREMSSCRKFSDERFNRLEERIKKQEDNTTWLVRTVIGQIIILFFGILVVVYTFMK